MKVASRRLTAMPVIALAGAACSSAGPSTACANAALQQALAEQGYGSAVEAHEAAHESGEEHSDSEIFDARVAMILAEAETRRQCG